MINKKFKKISIIIPVYNEKNTIMKVVSKVKKATYLGLTREIIIIDDASNDGTFQLIKKLKEKNLVKLFHKVNKGKGAAIRTGFNKASGDIIIIQDADLEYNPDEIKFLIDPIIKGDADVVYGSRLITNKPHRVLYFWHSMGNTILTVFSNAFTNLNLTDMETGYKAFNRKVFMKIKDKLSSDRFGIEPEITALVAKLFKNMNIKIYEVGISYYGRTYAEGKKINWKDGLAAFWYIIKYNLFSR